MALNNIKMVFLIPMNNLQTFVLAFDLLVMLYYVYNWQVWDVLKKKFVYF